MKKIFPIIELVAILSLLAGAAFRGVVAGVSPLSVLYAVTGVSLAFVWGRSVWRDRRGLRWRQRVTSRWALLLWLVTATSGLIVHVVFGGYPSWSVELVVCLAVGLAWLAFGGAMGLFGARPVAQ